MTKIIAICNPSGGVGKTTLTINLAESFERKGMKVLILDIEPLGCVSTIFLKDISIDIDKSSIDCDVFGTSKELIDIIPSECFYRNMGSPKIPIFDTQFGDSLSSTISHRYINDYDIIICDVPSHLKEAGYWALSVANAILIPVNGPFSLLGIRELAGIMNDKKKERSPLCEIGNLVLSAFDPRTNLSRELKKSVIRDGGDYLLKTIIPIDCNVDKANFSGKSVVEYSPTSRASIAYLQLADELLEKWNMKSKSIGSLISVNLRIPSKSFERVETKKEELGVSRSATVRLIIEKGLDALDQEKSIA